MAYPRDYGQQPYPQQQAYGQYGAPQYGQGPPPPQAGRPEPFHIEHASASSIDRGSFQGGSYSITHRDTNAVLNIDLQPGGSIRSRSGAMIHMSGAIELSGKVKFSVKKLFIGGELAESTYTGHGRVALGPTLFGDIFAVPVDGRQPWRIGKDAFLACTPGVSKTTRAQGVGKTLFSGEDLFVYLVGGQGLLWLTSFGAVDRLDLRAGEQHIVDNGHLVAWSCDYSIEKAGGGTLAGLKTGEGHVCRFTGPGTVYVQTRNRDDFEDLIRSLNSSD